MSSSELKTRTTHSIRIFHRLVEICEHTGLPLSNIIESCLVHFAALNDQDRIKFLVENDPDKADVSSFSYPEFNYADKAQNVAREHFGDKPLGRISTKALIAIGLAILVGLFFSFKKKE